ncbi:MAG TPA: DUF5916 domain-containing protein [Gemmatimonadaceae bacterium]|nr:DUF5916 domain-containing protein [Gemmatimonadaceae bacterium]
MRLTAPVTIDGKLDEEVWRTAQPATDFRQSQPDEGKPATQKTEVRFAFDDEAIYIGARMFDTMGAKGVHTRLLRRDAMTENDSDILQVFFDSYHDHTSTYNFWVNPSASKRDGTGDPTWDPVWETATRIDSLGWTAELRIPLNQLNFSRAIDQTWGVQIVRFEHRLNERSHFAWWPNNESGGAQRYGHIEGIKITERPRGFEVLPYTVARARYIRPSDPTNPFTKDNDRDYRIGGDVKYRLTSNLTLNATFNPDFGQVEVDPAVVNLSAFETFFPERRPFFIENANAFSYGNFSCFFCSNVSNLQMFYTRRIGRSPQLSPSGTYVDMPENATILAAGKITGRTSNNVRLGMLDAVTRNEHAAVISVDDDTGERTQFERVAEPLTNYFVARPRKEFKGGQYWVGAIATSVDRLTDDSLAKARLSRGARELGMDWYSATKDRTYTFFGQYALSDVRGSTTAIDRLQRSSARYFQRPDRESGGNGLFSDRYDPNATRLTGYAGYARVAKESGTWLAESMVNYRSPGFEVNDISFNTRSDYLWMNTNLARSITKPGPIFRNYFATLSFQQQLNYDGDVTDREFAVGMFTQLKNFWGWSAFTIYTPDVFDDAATRGGPVVKKRGYVFNSMSLSTDARRKISFSTNPNYQVRHTGEASYALNLNMTYKPTSQVQLSLGPQWNKSRGLAQFVTSGADSTNTAFFGRRYIFAQIDQRTLSMSTRANVTFTPTLTLEAFAQPLIASGDYRTFREFAAPRRPEFHNFQLGKDLTRTVVDGEVEYTVDVDGSGPSQPVSFSDPNFNFRSLRGNAVLRWEYHPGSTLFFVWQQTRSNTQPLGNFDFGRDRDALFSAHPDNIFLVKATYWIAF